MDSTAGWRDNCFSARRRRARLPEKRSDITWSGPARAGGCRSAARARLLAGFPWSREKYRDGVRCVSQPDAFEPRFSEVCGRSGPLPAPPEQGSDWRGSDQSREATGSEQGATQPRGKIVAGNGVNDPGLTHATIVFPSRLAADLRRTRSFHDASQLSRVVCRTRALSSTTCSGDNEICQGIPLASCLPVSHPFRSQSKMVCGVMPIMAAAPCTE